jgi:thiol:disulfide interchange protein DsbC
MIKILAVVVLSLLIPAALANEAAVRKNIEARFPGVPIRSVAKAPIKGLYEVVLQGRLLYVDEDASHLFIGSILDTKTRQNLTEERMRQLFRVKFDTLPLDKAIKVVKGNGRRRMAVFSDPDCPYCVKLEKELQGVNNVTVYTFLFPLDSLHPGASAKAKAIWCAPDRARAWDDWMRERRLPRTGAACATPLAQIAKLGRKLGVNGTPTIIFADGKVVPGAVSVRQLERLLNAAAGK